MKLKYSKYNGFNSIHSKECLQNLCSKKSSKYVSGFGWHEYLYPLQKESHHTILIEGGGVAITLKTEKYRPIPYIFHTYIYIVYSYETCAISL